MMHSFRCFTTLQFSKLTADAVDDDCGCGFDFLLTTRDGCLQYTFLDIPSRTSFLFCFFHHSARALNFSQKYDTKEGIHLSLRSIITLGPQGYCRKNFTTQYLLKNRSISESKNMLQRHHHHHCVFFYGFCNAIKKCESTKNVRDLFLTFNYTCTASQKKKHKRRR